MYKLPLLDMVAVVSGGSFNRLGDHTRPNLVIEVKISSCLTEHDRCLLVTSYTPQQFSQWTSSRFPPEASYQTDVCVELDARKCGPDCPDSPRQVYPDTAFSG